MKSETEKIIEKFEKEAKKRGIVYRCKHSNNGLDPIIAPSVWLLNYAMYGEPYCGKYITENNLKPLPDYEERIAKIVEEEMQRWNSGK